MVSDVRMVGYGRAASTALASVIADAQAGRPLAPVTVIVPSNFAGLSARRLLADGALGGTGLVNVGFVTPFRLAELLIGDRSPSGRALTNPVLAAAVRKALSEQPAPLSVVAGHEATEIAFARLFGELSHFSEVTLDELSASGGLPASGVAVCRRVSALLEDFAGEDDVVDAAAADEGLEGALRPLGHLVWYLPQSLTPAQSRMLRAVFNAASSTVIVGISGVEAADAPVLACCELAGVVLDATASVEAPTGSHIVSVSDCNEEVRAVVRRIAELAEEGVRLDRIGVIYPLADPYLTDLVSQLEAAGIPSNGPSPIRLADRVVGRTILAALALPEQRWRRDRVIALLAGGPIRHGDGPALPTVWDELSRRAGVVCDPQEWDDRLAVGRKALARRIESLDPVSDAVQVSRLKATIADSEALADFMRHLVTWVDDVGRAEGWVAKAEAAGQLLVHLLGEGHRRSRWPEVEVDAASGVDDALRRLSMLDEIEPEPSLAVFRRALSSELDEARGRSGRFGEGVVHGPLSGAVGLDLDAVFVLGMAEGFCPAPRREDALLPDAVRRSVTSEPLVLQADWIHDQHRELLAGLAAAPPERRYLLFPRSDLRNGRARLPSRWLLDTASALDGRTVQSTDFAALAEPVVDAVASFVGGLRAGPSAASPLDHDLGSLLSWTAAGGDVSVHPAAKTVRKGIEALRSRRSAEFTIWDGNLAGLAVPSPVGRVPLSASGLERWASCGFRYFLSTVLGVRERDEPERIVDIDTAERGSAVHAVLETFFAEVIARGAPEPDVSWNTSDRRRMQEIADEVFAELEATGRTGRPLRWRIEKQRLALLLDRFIDADDNYRKSARTRPERVELAFGMDGVAPAAVALGDGRQLLLRGRADRVDLADDGSRQVIDYKTGKGREYGKLDEGDPVRGGATLQLGVYSLAAAQHLGEAAISAVYWMVNEDAAFKQVGYPWDPPRQGRFVEVVTAIVVGIESGVFAAVPGEWDNWRGGNANCTYCDFDPVCPRDRGSFAEAKVAAPQLRIREILADPWLPT